jgi:hypothetical protein
MDGFRGWVLSAGKIPSEHEDHLRPLIDKTVALFGDPLSTMRDLMKAGPNVVAGTRKRGKPDLVCHYHFLGAVGKKLFDDPNSTLRGLLKQAKVRSESRELLRELRRYRKSDAFKGRFGSDRVGDDLLALVLWVLEGDGRKKPSYPFSLPHLEFYQRCRQAMQQAERWVPSPRTQTERRALKHFSELVGRVERDEQFTKVAEPFEQCWFAFCELRDVLRLTGAKDSPHKRPFSRFAKYPQLVSQPVNHLFEGQRSEFHGPRGDNPASLQEFHTASRRQTERHRAASVDNAGKRQVVGLIGS